MDSASKNWRNNHHFVTYTGAPTTDPATRKKNKQDVMQHIRRSRKNPLAVRRHVPLQCDLDVPQTFTEAHVYTSERPDVDITSQSNFASVSVPPDPKPPNSFRRASAAKDTTTRIFIRTSSSIPRLGAGRSDPFIKFPIELNSRSRELLDLSQFSTHEFIILGYSETDKMISIRRPRRKGQPTQYRVVSY